MELEWPLIIFTFFMCLAGGVFAIQGYLALRGKGKGLQFTSLVVATLAFAIGGLGVFMHLEHWERMFNGFGHLSSPITHEVIGVVIFALALVVYFLFMRRSEEGIPPKWAGVLAIVVGLAMPVLCGNSYMMVANPVWNTMFLLLFYLADAIMMGAFACFIIAKVKKDESAYKDTLLLATFGALARVAIVICYAFAIYTMSGSFTTMEYYFDPTMPDSHIIDPTVYMQSILIGELSPVFYLVVVLLGNLVPLGIALIMSRASLKEKLSSFSATGSQAMMAASVALACTVIGGVVWRCMLYWVCIQVFPYLSLG